MAYCCENYKHNPKHADACSIVGVRRAESAGRKRRTVFEAKNKTVIKKNKALFNEYFEEHCQSEGAPSIIQLKPIVDWTDTDVWNYIRRHGLPVNPEYGTRRRVGCIVCPKANFSSNAVALIRYPGLIDAFIRARERSTLPINWAITGENADYSDDKPLYICRWLNYSFMPFTPKQREQYRQVRTIYDERRKQGLKAKKTL